MAEKSYGLERLNNMKQAAASNLRSEEGLRLRAQRGVDVEPVFGRIKNNWGFRRFLLRGLEKVRIEWGLLSVALNLAKMAALKGRFFDALTPT